MPIQRAEYIADYFFHCGRLDGFAHRARAGLGGEDAEVAVGHARLELAAIEERGDAVIIAGHERLNDRQIARRQVELIHEL